MIGPKFIFHEQSQRDACKKMIDNLPLNGSMQAIISPYFKPCSASQRKAMWGVWMAEITEQAWWDGRQYTAPVWHQFCKERFLPDGEEEGITLPKYVKWIEMPDGDLRMVGSTERLTSKGKAEYMDRVEAFFGIEFGVRFSEFKKI